MRNALLATALFTICCAAPAAESPFDAAEKAAAQRQFVRARDLYKQAAASEADPERRTKAVARAANIEWRIMHDLDAARKTLADATEAKPLIERARAEGELAHDWVAAHTFAQRAIAAATKREDRRRAALVVAETLVRPIREARLDHRCVPAESLTPVIASLRAFIDREGPLLGASRLMLNVAILTNDRQAMLDAWRWYYGSVPDVPADRRGVGLALAKAKFFAEAAMVLADPCAKETIDDQETRDVLLYAGALRRINDIADEHYRRVALGTADVAGFRAAVQREGETLWQRLGEKGSYSPEALIKVLFIRFGTVGGLGKTAGIEDLHLAHAVVDTTRTIDQYGRRASIRFVALDGVVSNGYGTWERDGGGGDGGWNNPSGIFQIRPLYADDPIFDWKLVSDAEARAEFEREIARETKYDNTRDPLDPPIGMRMRLRLQANDALLAELKAKGLAGDALRSAFMERARDDLFASSILAHEGRHAIDAKEGIKDSPTLEFNAKLSEAAFAPSPRRAVVTGIFTKLDPSSPHGQANRRVLQGLTAWVHAHAGEIAGLDLTKPILPQFDKLTDEQIRNAFRSMDKLAQTH